MVDERAEQRGRGMLDERLELVVGIGALVALAVGCFLVLRPFLSALLWGVILAYTTWPLHARLVTVFRGRRTLAAAFMTTLLALAFVLPLVLVGSSIAEGVVRIVDLVRGFIATGLPPLPRWVEEVPVAGPFVADIWDQLAAGTSGLFALIQPYFTTIRDFAIGLGVGVGSGLLEITLSVCAAFFFYRDGERFARTASAVGGRIIGDRSQYLLEVAGSTTKSVVYGIVGTALFQGLLSGIGFWIVGIQGAFVLGFLSFFLALMPMGPSVIWAPIAIWLAYQGEIGWAIFLTLWGTIAVGSSDNFIRPWLISRGGRLTFLPVFLGVLGGALAFGFLGIFLGPVLLAVGIALVTGWTEPRVPVVTPPPPSRFARRPVP